MKNKMNIEELRDLIIDNFTDESGHIDISGLDFSSFDGNVRITSIKVKNDLLIGHQTVGGDMYAGRNRVSRCLMQCSNFVKKDLTQDKQTVLGRMFTTFNNNVKGGIK